MLLVDSVISAKAEKVFLILNVDSNVHIQKVGESP